MYNAFQNTISDRGSVVVVTSEYGSCIYIYNYLYNQCHSPLKLWVRIPFMARCTRTTLYDKVCQWLGTGLWFSAGIPVSSSNKIDRHDITQILLKVALNTITHNPILKKKKDNYLTIDYWGLPLITSFQSNKQLHYLQQTYFKLVLFINRM